MFIIWLFVRRRAAWRLYWWVAPGVLQAGRDGHGERARRCLHLHLHHCHHGQGAAQHGGPPPAPGDLRPPPARRDQRPYQRAAQHWYGVLSACLCPALTDWNFTDKFGQRVKITPDCFNNYYNFNISEQLYVVKLPPVGVISVK